MQRRSARLHPEPVAEQRVDLAVVSDVAERLGDSPVGKRVRRVALVEQGEGRDGVRIGQVGVEVAELRRDHQTLVDNGRGGHRDDVGLSGLVAGVGIAQGLILGVGSASRQVHTTRELILGNARGPADEQLLDAGKFTQRPTTEHRGVGRHDSPAEHVQSGPLRGGFQDGASALSGLVLPGQEHHREAEVGVAQPVMAQPTEVVLQNGVGNADGDAGPVARVRIGVDRSSVGQADHSLDSLLDQLVRCHTVQAGDESSAAGIAETLWIV